MISDASSISILPIGLIEGSTPSLPTVWGVGETVNATRYPLAETKVEDQVVASKLNLVRLAIKSEPGE